MRRILAAALGGLLATGALSAAATADPEPENGTVVVLAAPTTDDGTTDEDPTDNPDANARHVGTQPHAERNWTPRPDCINWNRVNGSIPAAFNLGEVIAEYRNKVPNLPPLRDLSGTCPAGNNAVIRVDYVPNPARNYCARYSPAGDQTSVVQITDHGTCDGHEREWSCSGIGQSIGEHGYRGSFTPRGCHWRGGTGPDHLSSGFNGSEAQVLNQAWN